MDALNIEKFDPTVADLKQLVEITSQVVVTDINDKTQIEEVKKNRIVLRDARVAITKRGKELREDAVKFQKAVIEKEKELIAIIEPEEDRLKAIEEEVKLKKLRAERIALLPERKKQLSAIGDGKDYSDKDELLIGMDATEFQAYLNARVAEKNEAIALENERKAAELKAEEDKLAREKETREREERARQEERERIEREQKEKEERTKLEQEREKQRIAQEKYDEELRIEREKKEAEARAHKEQQERERDARYQAFLKEHGYEKGSDEWWIEKDAQVRGRINLWKKVGVFNSENLTSGN